jgi:hypothetical protein
MSLQPIYLLVFYVILSRVHLSNISTFFYIFLTQNYELQFSFNVIITCNIFISVLCYFVSCASVQYLYFFYIFLTQNYELQFSFNVIITCNTKQYIVNYKHFNSNSPFPIFHKICLLLLLYMTSYIIE